MTDRHAWAAALALTPWDDELTRGVYADWLDDRGEHEEATRQRNYIAALRLLVGFTSQRIQKALAADPVGGKDAVRVVLRRWIEESRKGTRYGSEKDWPEFEARSGLQIMTEEQEAAFWRAMEVVTGAPFEEFQHKRIGYRPCAC